MNVHWEGNTCTSAALARTNIDCMLILKPDFSKLAKTPTLQSTACPGSHAPPGVPRSQPGLFEQQKDTKKPCR
jgi:hypothetical protein